MVKSKSRKEKTSSQEVASSSENGPISIDKDGHTVLHFTAKPNAKNTAVTGIDEGTIFIQIAAPPHDGEANAELIKYLSAALGIRKSDISLDKGARSREKKVVVFGLGKDDVLARLQGAMKR